MSNYLKPTPEQRLQKAVLAIMGMPNYTALLGVLMIGKKTISETVPTAATDGRDELYGQAFVESINDKQLRFAMLHECSHKMFRHLTTWQHLFNKNHMLANIAVDYVVNNKLMKDKEAGVAIEPVDGIFYDLQYDGMSTQQIYDLLEKKMQGSSGKGGKGIPKNSFDEHDWKGAKEMTQEEKQALAREIDSAIRQGAAMAGKLGQNLDRDIEDMLNPKVDWREVLRDFITTTCAGNDFSTWKRPNRRFISSGIYMPSGVSERVGELVIGIDTSGSIGREELSQFLGEVKGICDTVKPEKIRLLYWDTKVAGDETYTGDETHDLVKKTKAKGGGGTDPTCVPEYMHKNGIRPQAVIMLTDGYVGSWGTWDWPVLWCIVNNESATPPVGKCIHVEK